MELGGAQLYGFLAIVLAAIAFMIAERLVPYNPGQKLFRKGFWTDMLLYNFAQTYVLGLIIAGFIMWIDRQAGWSRLHIVTDWPVWAQVLLFLVAHDLYIYTMHRIQHRFPIMWKTHEAHHSTDDVDWLSGVRSHPVEILINQTIEFAPLIFLGAAPEVAIYKGAISAIWGMWIHSNLDIRSGWLQYVINGPEMHRWHHANHPAAYNKNFGTKFAIWDWIFGTAYLPRDKKASDYGLGYPGYPDGYIGQTLYAFLPESKRAKPPADHHGEAVSASDGRSELSSARTAEGA